MSVEPNQKMDELLKAYAKKRREEAGDMEMHPATRQLLQAEISRVYGRKEESWRTIRVWFPKLALAACLVALISVWFYAADRKPRNMELAQSKREITSAETGRVGGDRRNSGLDMPRSALSEDKTTLNSRSEHNFETPKSPQKPGSRMARSAVPATSAERKETSELAKTPLIPKTETVALATALEPSPQPEAALAPSTNGASATNHLYATAAPAAAPVTTFWAMTETVQDSDALAIAGEAKKQVAAKPATTAAAKETSKSGPSFTRLYRAGSAGGEAAILKSFRMERDGSRIRIIDADGSIYSGEITADSATTFRVTGTNHTVNEPVVFSGKLENSVPQIAGETRTHGETFKSKSRNLGFADSPSSGPEQLTGQLQVGTNSPSVVHAVIVR